MASVKRPVEELVMRRMADFEKLMRFRKHSPLHMTEHDENLLACFIRNMNSTAYQADDRVGNEDEKYDDNGFRAHEQEAIRKTAQQTRCSVAYIARQLKRFERLMTYRDIANYIQESGLN